MMVAAQDQMRMRSRLLRLRTHQEQGHLVAPETGAQERHSRPGQRRRRDPIAQESDTNGADPFLAVVELAHKLVMTCYCQEYHETGPQPIPAQALYFVLGLDIALRQG